MLYYDVLIIGGGPSGLSAAITTAKNGLNTAIVEEHLEIGYPLAFMTYLEKGFLLGEFIKTAQGAWIGVYS